VKGCEMYFSRNFQSKAEARRAIAEGAEVTVFQPGPFGGSPITDGNYTVEGPHYPQPHKFYGIVTVKDGKVVAVK